MAPAGACAQTEAGKQMYKVPAKSANASAGVTDRQVDSSRLLVQPGTASQSPRNNPLPASRPLRLPDSRALLQQFPCSPPASTLVAVHTNRGVVRISTDTAVIRICLRFARMRRTYSRMTSINAGECRIIGGINMAVGANRSVVRNYERSMAENRS